MTSLRRTAVQPSLAVTGTTRVTGIFGWPVDHSLSPALQNAAFRARKLDYVYLPFAVAPAALSAAVAAVRALRLAGVNVTVPHKEHVVPYLDAVDPLARRIGSVNTIVNRNGRLTGYNTDADGWIADLRALGVQPAGITAVLLGSGGAARAIAHALADAGAASIIIAARNRRTAVHIAAGLPAATAINLADAEAAVAAASLVVNATTLGMRPSDPSPLGTLRLHKDLFVYDLIYHHDTALLRQARRSGAALAGGIGMLVEQGARAFELWTGAAAPRSVMRQAAVNAVRTAGRNALR